MKQFALALIFGVGLLAGPARAAPLDAFARLPQFEDMAISPDGALLAVVATDGESRGVMITRTGTKEVVGGVDAGDTKLRALQWAGSRHLLITYSIATRIAEVIGPKRERQLTLVYDVETKKQTPLIGKVDAEIMNTTYYTPQVRIIDGEVVVFVHGVEFVDNVGRLSLFRSVLGERRTRIVETGTRHADEFLVDAKGEVIARTEYNDEKGQWTLSLKKEGRWQPRLQGSHALGSPNLIGTVSGANAILVGMSSEEGSVINELDLSSGEIRPSARHKGEESLIHGPSGEVIGSYELVGDEDRYTFINPREQAIWASIRKAYPGQHVSLVSWSDDRRRIVVHVDSPTEGPAYALVDLGAKTATWIGPEYRGIAPADIAPAKPIQYAAADGLQIPGYLTLPSGRTGPLPLVVLPHGGPASRDVLRFDYIAQAIASQGYAVLQPNFRGSDGLGDEFLEAGYGEFGRKMQTDLSDGVRHLVKEGLVDPKRVCIVGASYGGYAALAGATLDSEVYRCAIAIAGISDLARMLRSERSHDGAAALRYWNNFIGVDGARDPELRDISPIHHVQRIKAPVLLIHGKDDTVVLYEQSRVMAEAMQRAGKPVKFVTLKGEDHWLSRGETRQQMLTEVVTFLREHNPPD